MWRRNFGIFEWNRRASTIACGKARGRLAAFIFYTCNDVASLTRTLRALPFVFASDIVLYRDTYARLARGRLDQTIREIIR